MRATRAGAPIPVWRMNRGRTEVSHLRPSGSNGRSDEPTQKRRVTFPELSALNSSVRPPTSDVIMPPSRIRRTPLGDNDLTSVSSSVNSTSPSYFTSSFSPLFDQLNVPCDWLPLVDTLCTLTAARATTGVDATHAVFRETMARLASAIIGMAINVEGKN